MMLYSIVDQGSLRKAFADFQKELLALGLEGTCLFDSKLVFSELASNAVKHAVGGGSIRVHVSETEVEITLLCEGGYVAPERSFCSSIYEEGGRGLYLIDSVCDRRENTAEGIRVVLIRK